MNHLFQAPKSAPSLADPGEFFWGSQKPCHRAKFLLKSTAPRQESICPGEYFRIVASLWLKNERGERLSSHKVITWQGSGEDCTICAMFKEFFLTWVFNMFNSATYSLCSPRSIVYMLQFGLFFVGIFRSESLELILVDYAESKEESSSRAFKSRLWCLFVGCKESKRTSIHGRKTT